MGVFTHSQIILYFFIYSFLGWVCEVIFCSILQRRAVNRGFLKGPYCPIYGVGAVAVLLVTKPVEQYPPLVFLFAMIAATALEYFASWLMETLFQMRWWDYSDQRFNLNGRTCLGFSLLFGVMGWGMAYILHPPVEELAALIPQNIQRVVSNGIVAVMLLDILGTVNSLLGFTARLKELQADLAELQKYEKQYDWFDHRDIGGSLRQLYRICEQNEDNPVSAKVIAVLDSISEKRAQGSRLLHAFPSMRTEFAHEALDAVRESAQQKQEALWRRLRPYFKRFEAKSAYVRKKAAVAVKANLSYYNLFWIFVVASVAGYVVESIYCLATRGYIESRQGMLYGPFNQVYGFGALLMTLILSPFREKNDRWLFVGGTLVGGGFETLVSVIQEYVFGSVSWQYADEPFAVMGGRTSLLYMFFWGILGFLFIKGILPQVLRIADKIPKRLGVVLTVIFTIALGTNMLISGAAVFRWAERTNGAAPSNAVEAYFDERFPDEMLEEVYPNLVILPKDTSASQNKDKTGGPK